MIKKKVKITTVTELCELNDFFLFTFFFPLFAGPVARTYRRAPQHYLLLLPPWATAVGVQSVFKNL
jgi:hypothetical protein